MDLSVIIPAKNEQDNIAPLVEEIIQTPGLQCLYEIIYVDDGSTDDTAGRILAVSKTASVPVRLIRHKRSVGQSTAIFTGVAHASGKLIVTLDADGQNNPADIPAMLKAAAAFSDSEHFCIAGYRKARKDTAWKRFQSKVANKIRSSLLGDDTPDTGCGLKVFPAETFRRLPYFDYMHRFLPALIRRMGGKIVVIEVSHRDRQTGTSKYNMLGRLGVGIVDLFGVLWLQKRCKHADIISE